MDAASYALAQKKADDPGIKEIQLTTDGEENYSFARQAMAGTQIEQQQEEQQGETAQAVSDKNARVAAVTITWSRDSRRFALVRRDQRKVGDLWVINALAVPRPKLETYRYAMPGEANRLIEMRCPARYEESHQDQDGSVPRTRRFDRERAYARGAAARAASAREARSRRRRLSG
jgi:hypothetical protein